MITKTKLQYDCVAWGIRLQSNQPVLWIRFNVSSRMNAYSLSHKNLYHHTITVVTKIHLIYISETSGCNNASTPARRPCLCTSKQGQSNKKCSVSHICCTHFIHFGLVVSLNLLVFCDNLAC